MSCMSFSSGSCILSLDSMKTPSSSSVPKNTSKASVSRLHRLAVMDEFDAVIDNAIKGLISDALTKIADFFSTDVVGMQRENIFCQRFTSRKLKMGIVQCNVSDVEHLVDGLVDRLQRMVSDPIVLKSGDVNIRGVVNRIRDCNDDRKPLVVIEQAESFNPWLLNGLVYSLASLQSDTLVLLCVSTKKTMLTSIVSRRCLSSLYTRSFSFSIPEEVFGLLVPTVMLSPLFTNLQLDPEFLTFLRSSFFRDSFSVSHMKKCLRFAFLRHIFTNAGSNVTKEISEAFVREVNAYMDALNFLHTNLYSLQVGTSFRRSAHILQLHEDIQKGNFLSKVKNSDDYKNWIQSLYYMSPEEISTVLQHLGIASHNIVLPSTIQNGEPEMNQQTLVKITESKVTALNLKEKMKEIISAKQRNPYVVARQKAVFDVENVFRSVLRPFSSFSQSSHFLIGGKSTQSLAPNITKDIEASLVTKLASPLNVALQALLKQGRWKTVTLSKWGETFCVDSSVQGLRGSKDELEPMFFACVGQLEHMGIIRASREHEIQLVTIAHHVLSLAIHCS